MIILFAVLCTIIVIMSSIWYVHQKTDCLSFFKQVNELIQLHAEIKELKQVIKDLLPYAEQKVKDNEKWCNSVDSQEAFYGEDLLTYPLVLKAKRLIK